MIQISNLPALMESENSQSGGGVGDGVSAPGFAVAGASEGDNEGGPGPSIQRWGEAQVIE